MRKILIITLILIAIFISGCQYATKTSDSKIRLINYSQTDCQGNEEVDQPNIVSKDIQNNVLTLVVELKSSCCMETKGVIKLLENNTIDLSYEYTSDEICNCICDYRLTYVIEGINNFEDYNYQIHGTILK